MVVVEQIEIEDLVGDLWSVVHALIDRLFDVADAAAREDLQRTEFGNFAQIAHEFVDPDIEIQFGQFDAGDLFEALAGHVDDLAATGFQASFSNGRLK